MTQTSIVTIERHMIEEERKFPPATGALSNVLHDIALAKLIDGPQRMLHLQPRELHERTPLFLGTAEYVDLAERYLAATE